MFRYCISEKMRRAEEITYYDELGVAADASMEEIRESFRCLVRLLHPDHQADPQLRDMAERQMRKINRIYAVLADPDRRRLYDLSLRCEPRNSPVILFNPAANRNSARMKQRIAWLTVIAATAMMLVWVAFDGPAQSLGEADHRNGPAAPNSAAAAELPKEIQHLRQDLQITRLERDTAVHELNRMQGVSARLKQLELPHTTADEVKPVGAAAAIVTEGSSLATSAQPIVSSPPAREESKDPSPRPGAAAPAGRFDGFWFYARPPRGQPSQSSTLYAPEFIEATIHEENGAVRGKYRARYQIVDRAIPPDVNFEFAGKGDGLTAVCPWTGPGGAKGQITLTVTGENSMQVDWTATALGAGQGLILGTANLTRRID